MPDIFTILNIALLLVFVWILFVLQKRYLSFSKRVFIALGLGLALGFFVQIVYGAGSEVARLSGAWFGHLGNGYVRLLRMIVVPLVMVSLLMAVLNLSNIDNLGKIVGSVIAILMITTAVAALVGVTASLIFNLNAETIHETTATAARAEILLGRVEQVEGMTLHRKIIEIIPTTPFAAMAGQGSSSILSVVFFSTLLGVAGLGVLKKKPEQGKMFKSIVEAFHSVVMRLVTLIIRLTPYGILGMMARMATTTNWAQILELGKFIAASYVALIVMFIIHLAILFFTGLNPVQYLSKSLPVLIFAFTSRTSAGTIPLNVETQEKKFGVSEGIANLSASLGSAIGQNGCAGIYPAMLAVMIAKATGVNPVEPLFLIQLVLIIVVSSFGVAGVGGGATFAALIVLSAMDMPIALAGLLIAIEPLIDMGRTAVNVSGSMVASLVTAKRADMMDMDTYNAVESK